MLFKLFFIHIILLVSFSVLVSADDEDVSDPAIEKQNGINLALQAVNVLINGDEPGVKTYKDIFIDTSKTVYDQLENANEQVTVDDLLRIFVQSVLILVAERRPDLIPEDFNGKRLPLIPPLIKITHSH